MRPGPCGFFVTAGETTSTGVSSNLKMRSLAAIADCRMLYFSLKSMMGRKKRMAYCVNAIRTPSDAAVATKVKEISVLRIELDAHALGNDPAHHILPANQMTHAIAIAEKKSTTG